MFAKISREIELLLKKLTNYGKSIYAIWLKLLQRIKDLNTSSL
ncbi:hypothetical protein B4U80_07230 [Leptotrombidium deliense]|uniref:Uncharacterized protein n=1 Tax=Leptotrombidium deliense TaxID=299467 RepID=A0A443RTR0_9ACAR|nr:hypothetical protein B4U80_07230 [Leptotrombidium deliense]